MWIKGMIAWIGIFAVVEVLIRWFDPDRLVSLAPLACVGPAWAFNTAKQQQSEMIQKHKSAGGKLARGALLIGLAWLAGVVAVGVTVAIALPDGTGLPDQKVVVEQNGAKVNVYYDQINQNRAHRFGYMLIEAGLVGSGTQTTISIRENDTGVVVTMALSKEALGNSDTVEAVRKVVREAAKSIKGLPMQVRLTDSEGDVKRRLTIE